MTKWVCLRCEGKEASTWTNKHRKKIRRQSHLKYGRMVSYFWSPIPFTFFRSSALLNGRASTIRRAITGPIPGINLSSFSVAVLMSNLAGNNLSFLLVIRREAVGDAVFGTPREELGIVAEDSVGAVERLIFAAQPPNLCCFASSSSSSSFCRSTTELEALRANMKTVAVIAGIRNKLTMLELSPFLPCPQADSRNRKRGGNKKRRAGYSGNSN